MISPDRNYANSMSIAGRETRYSEWFSLYAPKLTSDHKYRFEDHNRQTYQNILGKLHSCPYHMNMKDSRLDYALLVVSNFSAGWYLAP